MPNLRKFITAVISGVLALSGLSQAAAQEATLAPVRQSGYVLRRVDWNGENVHVISFTGGGDQLILKAIPAKHYRGTQVPSVLGTRAGAVAATNGQYRIPGTTRPKSPTIVDGNQLAQGNGQGWELSISESGTQAQVTHDDGAIPSWAYEVFGGLPEVVTNGVNTGRRYPYSGAKCHRFADGCHDAAWTDYNPRTVVGISEGCSDSDDQTTCTFFLVTVDGRQPPHSTGLRFPQLGSLMKHLGAYDAINLDGGGSTVMWTRHRSDHCVRRERVGCLVNSVSASNTHPKTGERSVIDAIGIFPWATRPGR